MYASAFRKIVKGCRDVLNGVSGEHKVLFVWHSWAAPLAANVELEDFFPGDTYVDWVGVSIFQQVYPNSNGAYGSIETLENVLNFAKDHGKPTMIAESTPFGGIHVNSWENWFQNVLNVIDQYDISMWSYINCNWDSQPMWRSIGFGDTRISQDEAITSRWMDLINGESNFTRRKFLGSGSIEHCGHQNKIATKKQLFTNGGGIALTAIVFAIIIFIVRARGKFEYSRLI
mmetsp:Transcript_37877/g.88150  ORF Transcript_37877/g.88150 Transcript_37877/m.88150 type:complete len:230 (-) Transcript_37877:168-857(-)